MPLTTRDLMIRGNIRHRCFSTKAQVRPFTILGVQQVAIGCETRDPLRHLWQDVFGIEPSSSHTLQAENVQEDILELGGVEIDLMTPIDPEKSPKVSNNLRNTC